MFEYPGKLIWSKHRPHVAGWYWHRVNGIYQRVVFYVESEIKKVQDRPYSDSSEWAGPVKVPIDFNSNVQDCPKCSGWLDKTGHKVVCRDGDDDCIFNYDDYKQVDLYGTGVDNEV